MKRQIDVYRRTLRVLGLVVALTCSHRAFAQEGAVTRLDLPIGRAYPYRADEIITRVTVANPGTADAIVISEREVVLNAAAAGEGDIILWLQSGRRVHFRVQVHTLLVVKAKHLMDLRLRRLGVLDDGNGVLDDVLEQRLDGELLGSDIDLVALDLRVVLAL